MSEGLFGRFISGLFGWAPKPEPRAEEPEKHRCLDPRCNDPLSEEHLRQMQGMRQMDPKSLTAQMLAGGMAAVPHEELERRQKEEWERWRKATRATP